jgi:murein DD-endopeptidase MepM/ murein hydrolase activator NlpD
MTNSSRNHFIISLVYISLVMAVPFDPPVAMAADGAVSSAKALKRKSSPITDPAKMSEILEQAVIATESAESGTQQDNLNLPVKGRVSSTVGPRVDPINGVLRFHQGVDIAIPEGTPVTPVSGGRIAYSGSQQGYGNMVIIQHDDGMMTIYAHHSKNLVKVGDRVDMKSSIALVGSTGHSTGPHLHFEAWKGGKNVTEAFLPNFSGRKFGASTHISLDKTNLRKVILADGTLLFVEIKRQKQKNAGDEKR